MSGVYTPDEFHEAQDLSEAFAEFDAAFGGPPRARPLRTCEQNEVLGIFHDMLAGVMSDGGAKRAAGTKPSWKVDDHLIRGLGHLDRYIHEGERVDKDSGCHPLIHVAARLLMHAWQEDEAAGLHPQEPPS